MTLWRRGRARALAQLWLALGAMLALATAAAADGEGSFLAGKTVNLIVGMPPGGGEDVYARLVQRHLATKLAGGPSIVVQNLPGAGSLRSVLALEHAAEDGTTIDSFSPSLILEAILYPERVKVDFRDFAFLGNVSEDVRVCFVRSELGISDLAGVARREALSFGATAPGTSGNVDVAILRNLFGIQIKQVNGYAGSAAKRLALESGEIDGDCGGFTSLPANWLSQAKIRILLRLSPTLIPDMDPAIPTGAQLLGRAEDRQLFDFLIAPERLGRLFMVSAKVPAERIAALRAAFDRMMADPDFLTDAAHLRLTVMPMAGADVDRRIAELYATPPALLALARAITGG